MSKSEQSFFRLNSSVKNKVIVGVSSAVGYLVVVASVYAQGLQAPGGSLNPDTKIETLPQVIVNYLFLIAAFLAVAYLMYGGIKWITSRGDKTQVESARKHIVAAVIGLLIVAGSFFALNTIFSLLGADNPLKEGFKLQTIEEVNDQVGNTSN